MKKKDFADFKVTLNIQIEIDSSIRRIGEKIALLTKLRKTDELAKVSELLSMIDYRIDEVVDNSLAGDE